MFIPQDKIVDNRRPLNSNFIDRLLAKIYLDSSTSTNILIRYCRMDAVISVAVVVLLVFYTSGIVRGSTNREARMMDRMTI
jgi:hypothetical protein